LGGVSARLMSKVPVPATSARAAGSRQQAEGQEREGGATDGHARAFPWARSDRQGVFVPYP
jgi:hypothetical protein